MNDFDKVFDVIEKLDNEDSSTKIQDAIMDFISGLGFNAYCLGGLPDPNQHNHSDFVILNGWPEEWLNIYVNREYIFEDPVIKEMRRGTEPLLWTRDSYPDLESDEARILNEGAEFGLRSGCTIPIFSTHGFQSCMTFCSNSERLDLPPRISAALHLLAIYAHGKLSNVLSSTDNAASDKPSLSAREFECLKWASVGKTSWEIGEILGISNRTVETYFASVRKKLNTYSTIQSVAEAIRIRLLS